MSRKILRPAIIPYRLIIKIDTQIRSEEHMIKKVSERHFMFLPLLQLLLLSLFNKRTLILLN